MNQTDAKWWMLNIFQLVEFVLSKMKRSQENELIGYSEFAVWNLQSQRCQICSYDWHAEEFQENPIFLWQGNMFYLRCSLIIVQVKSKRAIDSSEACIEQLSILLNRFEYGSDSIVFMFGWMIQSHHGNIWPFAIISWVSF